LFDRSLRKSEKKPISPHAFRYPEASEVLFEVDILRNLEASDMRCELQREWRRFGRQGYAAPRRPGILIYLRCKAKRQGCTNKPRSRLTLAKDSDRCASLTTYHPANRLELHGSQEGSLVLEISHFWPSLLTTVLLPMAWSVRPTANSRADPGI
jgi:hypothetical protein